MEYAILIVLAVLLIVGFVVVGWPIAMTAIHDAEAGVARAEAEAARAEADAARARAEAIRARGEAEAAIARAEGEASVTRAQASAITSAAFLPWALAIGAFCGWPWLLIFALWLFPRPAVQRYDDGGILELWQAIRVLARQINSRP
jgi:hypothetical protein